MVLILIAGGFVGGYWYGAEKSKIKTETAKTEQAVTEGVCLKDMSISDAGSNLKNYKNDRYGFEFSYPNDYELEVNADFEAAASVTLSSKKEKVGGFTVGVVYNPTLVDPLTAAKQSNEECLAKEKELEAKGEPTGVSCGLMLGNIDQWKVTKINDHLTGYRTGIQAETILTDTYYLMDSQYKGRILKFTANITNIPSRTDSQSDPVLVATNDKDVKNFLGVFDQIINSAKVNWLGI